MHRSTKSWSTKESKAHLHKMYREWTSLQHRFLPCEQSTTDRTTKALTTVTDTFRNFPQIIKDEPCEFVCVDGTHSSAWKLHAINCTTNHPLLWEQKKEERCHSYTCSGPSAEELPRIWRNTPTIHYSTRHVIQAHARSCTASGHSLNPFSKPQQNSARVDMYYDKHASCMYHNAPSLLLIPALRISHIPILF